MFNNRAPLLGTFFAFALLLAAGIITPPSAAAHGPHVSVDRPTVGGAGVSAADVRVDQPDGRVQHRGGACAGCAVVDPTASPLAPLAATGLFLAVVWYRRKRG